MNPKANPMITPMYCVEHGTMPTRRPDGSYIYRVSHAVLAGLPDGHKERVDAMARAAASCLNYSIDYESDAVAYSILLYPSTRAN